MLRRMLPLATVAAASLALVPAAGAHNISLSPRSGDLNTPFRFVGTAWEPRGRLSLDYFATPNAAAPFRRYALSADRTGRFRVTWRDALVGRTHKICFRQFDTRVARTFRKCERFWVAPPYAQWVPTSGNPGDLFVLFVSGFPTGHALTVTTTPPPGIPAGGSFTVTTATSAGFISNVPCAGGSPVFGPVFVPRGGAACGFTGGSAGPGLYTSLVRDPGTGFEAYATARLLR